MQPDTVKKQKTSWHRLLARLLELVLAPVHIEVLPDVSMMIAPEADVLLLRRLTAQWTAAQRALLPDGIRDSKASHILIEFTQSFNEDALAQAIGEEFFGSLGYFVELNIFINNDLAISKKLPKTVFKYCL